MWEGVMFAGMVAVTFVALFGLVFLPIYFVHRGAPLW
jgi:hypothetical protein